MKGKFSKIILVSLIFILTLGFATSFTFYDDFETLDLQNGSYVGMTSNCISTGTKKYNTTEAQYQTCGYSGSIQMRSGTDDTRYLDVYGTGGISHFDYMQYNFTQNFNLTSDFSFSFDYKITDATDRAIHHLFLYYKNGSNYGYKGILIYNAFTGSLDQPCNMTNVERDENRLIKSQPFEKFNLVGDKILNYCFANETGLEIKGFYFKANSIASADQYYSVDNIDVSDEYVDLLPTIVFFESTNDPVDINETVHISTLITDDNPDSEIYSAVDCNSDTIFEYPMAVRGKSIVFNCTYASQGNFTAFLAVTDINNTGINNRTATDNVEVISEAEVVGNCTGFVAPVCNPGELFCDDFSYTNPIFCNGWVGTADEMSPSSNVLRITGQDYTEFNIEWQPNITSYYSDFTVEFDIKLNENTNHYFTIYDFENNAYSVYLQFNNYQMIAYDNVLPTTNNFGTLNSNQTYNVRMVVRLQEEEIDYYLDDVFKATTQFYDNGVENADWFAFTWTSISQDFTIDNFIITSGSLNEDFDNVTTTIEDYTYDSNYFCAINWTAEPFRFSQYNCEQRGYATNGSLLGLCLPRACISDVGSAIFESATNNILVTIVIVTMIILIAPLVIAIGSRRRR